MRLLDERQRVFLIGVACKLEGFQFGFRLGRRLDCRLRRLNRFAGGLIGRGLLVEATIALPSRF